MKKAEIAEAAATRLAGSGWLPPTLHRYTSAEQIEIDVLDNDEGASLRHDDLAA